MSETSHGHETEQSGNGSPATSTALAAAPPPLSHRDQQRAALRDLAALATECATTEAQVEQRYHATLASEKQEVEKSAWAIEQFFKSAAEQVKVKYSERTAAITAKYTADAAAVAKNDKVVRRRIQAETEPQEREVREKYDGSIWMADGVLESALARVNAEVAQARQTATQQVEQITAMELEAGGLLKTYGIPAPPASDAPPPALPAPEQLETALAEARDTSDRELHTLRTLRAPQWFIGVRPYVLILLFCIIGAVAAQVLATYQKKNFLEPNTRMMGIGAGAGFAFIIALGLLVRSVAKSGVKSTTTRLQASISAAQEIGKARLEQIDKDLEKRTADANAQRKAEGEAAKAKYGPLLTKIKKSREAGLAAAQKDLTEKTAKVEGRRDKDRAEADDWYKKNLGDATQKRDRDLQMVRERNQRHLAVNQKKYDEGRAELEKRLQDGIAAINTPINPGSDDGAAPVDWNDPAWSTWKPPKKFLSEVRFGDLRVDLPQIANAVPKPASQGPLKLVLPAPFNMPTTLGVPVQASLLIQADRSLREQAIRTLQMVMLRLLTGLPPGRVRFTIIDPVGLGQTFAGFMHLADHDEALVGAKIWTERDQIDQRLIDLTEHMETVIQKYLRNEFETIDDYNKQAGELSEPYRFLVIADFPVSFEMEALRRLSSIASSGARCGVYTLIARDTRQSLLGTIVDDLEHHSVNIVQEGDRLVWKDDVFSKFPLTLDPPPTDDVLTKILDVVGRSAKEAKRVEVPFDAIAPTQQQFWSLQSGKDLGVPIGRMGASRQQWMRLGKGVAQHVLIAGKTGSGKSTLLHALVTNLAMWYTPDEVELYLIDFKKGVEFKTYASHELPHARAIAVESDREFGISVLQRLDAELSRRGDIFRRASVQDLPSYKQSENPIIMPRTLLIIDEFQEFFSEDDKLSAEAALLLDRLVRQGRAFGVHVLLGSQTIGGAGGLNRSTITQMAVRIALMTSDADSQLILGDGNGAARLLSRPGEAIYNDVGGLLEGNSPFQVAYLSDAKRDEYLEEVTRRSNRLFASRNELHEPPIVFEGNALADVKTNKQLTRLLESAEPAAAPTTGPLVWLGDPVAIKDPTAIQLRRNPGSNILIIGQNDEAALAMMTIGAIGVAAQMPIGSAIFYVVGKISPDSVLAGGMETLRGALHHETKMVGDRALEDTINELSQEIDRRRAGDASGLPSIFIILYGMQSYRSLRKAEDDFSFSSMGTGDEPKKANTGKQFADLLKEGPTVGIHVFAWCDTPVAVERTLDRNTLREFDNRVLFQMSGADSSNLIDNPMANKLGFYRALIYSEEQGMMEKFRPYALPPKGWLEKAQTHLAARTRAAVQPAAGA